MVNVSIGNGKHKDSILSRDQILVLLQKLMTHESGSIRVATIWCLINLTWADDSNSTLRVSRLRNFGFEEKLRTMLEDTDLDVIDRVKTALSHFSGGGGGGVNVVSNSSSSSNMQIVD